jgi:hypothetical protein
MAALLWTRAEWLAGARWGRCAGVARLVFDVVIARRNYLPSLPLGKPASLHPPRGCVGAGSALLAVGWLVGGIRRRLRRAEWWIARACCRMGACLGLGSGSWRFLCRVFMYAVNEPVEMRQQLCTCTPHSNSDQQSEMRLCLSGCQQMKPKYTTHLTYPRTENKSDRNGQLRCGYIHMCNARKVKMEWKRETAMSMALKWWRVSMVELSQVMLTTVAVVVVVTALVWLRLSHLLMQLMRRASASPLLLPPLLDAGLCKVSMNPATRHIINTLTGMHNIPHGTCTNTLTAPVCPPLQTPRSR